MNSDSIKGFGVGCIASVLLLVGGIFLFVLMCGLLVRGCLSVTPSSNDALASSLAKFEKPEDNGDFTKVWVAGSNLPSAVKVLRVKIRGVLSDDVRPRLFDLEDTASAVAALRQIRSARRDTSIRGLWLDIDSPGGSVTLSDRLHDAVVNFKSAQTNRFVLVHMGDLCCSGGYYVSAAADIIVARPTTLTGSIGVIMNGVNAADLAKKLGITSVTIASAANKDLLNPLKPVDPAHVEILKKPILDMYDRFVDIVAKGRHLPKEKVRALADGRVFSAADAKANDLVDTLGHEDVVFALLKHHAGNKPVKVFRYREKPNIERLLSSSLLFENTGDLARELKAQLDAAATPAAEYRLR